MMQSLSLSQQFNNNNKIVSIDTKTGHISRRADSSIGDSLITINTYYDDDIYMVYSILYYILV